jgi:hypothetical protein
MSICEQMSKIGSAVEEALNWRAEGDPVLSQKAFDRAIGLVDLTIESLSDTYRVKEIIILRKALIDYFQGMNEFNSTDASWRKYFGHFNYAARKQKAKEIA